MLTYKTRQFSSAYVYILCAFAVNQAIFTAEAQRTQRDAEEHLKLDSVCNQSV
jgi:hypothetical protein